MIRGLVDFALNNRFMILAAAILLFIWGGISFHNLPVEAYPDVANNYVTIITQWPGRAAEEVEQQVTVPLEIVYRLDFESSLTVAMICLVAGSAPSPSILPARSHCFTTKPVGVNSTRVLSGLPEGATSPCGPTPFWNPT